METSLFISCALILSAFTFSFAGFVNETCVGGFCCIGDFFDRMGQGKGTISQFAKTSQGGILLGMISGWFIGAYTTGGPPAVIYSTARFAEPRNAKVAMGLYFLATDALIVLLFSMTGLLTVELFFQAIRFTPAVLSGFLAGSFFFNNINRGSYLIGVHVLLLVSAVMLCVK